MFAFILSVKLCAQLQLANSSKMGIKGLLQFLKPCVKNRHIKDLQGLTAAVDTYAWLHKIIKGPSGKDLIFGGPNKYSFVKECLKRIDRIQKQGVKLLLVFDGGPLPRKQEQEQHRKQKRNETFLRGKEMLQNGDEAGFQKIIDSIDITPDIAYKLIIELQKNNIQYIVAPYEADAQLAYLNRIGVVDFILTQDSDLLAFGAKRVLYKFNFITLTGEEIFLDQIKYCKEVNFCWFDHNMFLLTCILSGCDYLPQIEGIGIKTAQRIICRVVTLKGFLGQITNKSIIPPDYEQNCVKAFLTFRFQRVYCPIRKICTEINDLNSSLIPVIEIQKPQESNWSQNVLNQQIIEFFQTHNLDLSFLGIKYSDEIINQIAKAQINPVTLTQYKTNLLQDFEQISKMPTQINSTFLKSRQHKSYSKINKKKNEKSYNQEINGMKSFLSRSKKQIQKYNPFRDDQYIPEEDQSNSSGFISVDGDYKDYNFSQFNPNSTNNPQRRLSLRFNQQSNENINDSSSQYSHQISSESVVEIVQNIQDLVQIMDFKPQLKQIYTAITDLSIQDCIKSNTFQNQFQKIIQTCFEPMFNREELRNPFSFAR